jgi:hypothetical protein
VAAARSGARRRCVMRRETTSPGGPAGPGDGMEAGWNQDFIRSVEERF